MIKYTDCDIPARLFYVDLMDKKDDSVLGTGTPEEIEEAKLSILDEYAEITKSYTISDWYKRNAQIAGLHRDINLIRSIMYMMATIPIPKEEFIKLANGLNELKSVRVRFDINKPLEEEIIRVNTKVIGSLNNKLKQIEAENEQDEKAQKFVYDQEYMQIYTINGGLPKNPTLRQYLYAKKIAQEKSKKQSNGE